MAYNQKKSILSGTSGHRKALNLHNSRLKIDQAMDESSLKDGRAKSSAFQKVTEEDAEKIAKANLKKNTKSTTKVIKEKGTKDGMEGTWTHTDVTSGGTGVGSAAFNEAFKKALAAKQPTFMFNGKEYTTDLASKSTKRTSTFEPNITTIPTIPTKPVTIPMDTPETNITGKTKEQCLEQSRSPRAMERRMKKCNMDLKGYGPGMWDPVKCRCIREASSSTKRRKKVKNIISDVVDASKRCIPVFNKETGVWKNKCVKG